MYNTPATVSTCEAMEDHHLKLQLAHWGRLLGSGSLRDTIKSKPKGPNKGPTMGDGLWGEQDKRIQVSDIIDGPLDLKRSPIKMESDDQFRRAMYAHIKDTKSEPQSCISYPRPQP